MSMRSFKKSSLVRHESVRRRKKIDKKVQRLIDSGSDVNVTDAKGKTCLFSAVDAGVRTVHKLIKCGIDVNIADNEGKTAIFYAVQRSNNESVVLELIKFGADVSKIDNEGKTALFYVKDQINSENMVRALVEAGVDVDISDNKGKSALFYFVRYSCKSVALTLVEAGADVNLIDKKGKTALFYAVQLRNNEKVVRALINAGLDVRITDNEGKSVLFYVKGPYGNETVIQVLTGAGVDVNITDNEGKTALFYAVQLQNNENVSHGLIVQGADVNITDDDGKTALFFAVQLVKNENVVRIMIAAGADINITDYKGRTALFYVNDKDNTGNMVRLLLDAGADANITDKDGKTALFFAVQFRHNKSLVCALIDAGVDVKITDNEKKTALFYADQCDRKSTIRRVLDDSSSMSVAMDCSDGEEDMLSVYGGEDNYSMAQTLIEYGGASVDVKDCNNRTPLFYAITESLVFTAYLLDKGATLHSEHALYSFLTFFVETESHSLPGTLDHLRNGLQLLIDNKIVDKKMIFKAIVSVAFCITLCFKFGPADIDVDSLSELLNLSKDYTSFFEIGKRETVKTILKSIKEDYSGERLIESGVASTILCKLVNLGANPNTMDSIGNTALHYACQLSLHGISGKTVIDICEQLKKLGVSIDKTNHKNETPLLLGLSRSIKNIRRKKKPWPGLKTQTAVCDFLLDNGSSLQDKSGKNVLNLTLELLQQGFLQQDNEFKKMILEEAIKLLQLFLDAYSRKERSVTIEDDDKSTPLHLWATLELASIEDYSNIITEGYTFKGILDITLKLFMESKFQLTVKNDDGRTPLHLCRTWTAVELLLDAEALPNVVDSSGNSPLLVAAQNLKLLNTNLFYPDFLQEPKTFWKAAIERGIDLWTVNKNGQSVWSILIESESLDLAKAMVEVVCEDESLNQSNNSILFSFLVATCKDKSLRAHWKADLVQMMLNSRKCSASGKEGESSPLHFCCRNIMEEYRNLRDVHSVYWAIAENLLLNEADYESPDTNGQSCLNIAEWCPELKELLLKPIDIYKAPLLIHKWKPISKMHKDKLVKVARGRESRHIESYWYHKEYLAGGAFGAVFAGISENDGREVAIKRIEKLRMTKRKEDKREIKSLVLLADCEQVVRYLYFFEDENFSYVVLELMEGSLDDILDDKITTETRIQLCHDVVKGLQYLHDKNILHRDLKPPNILYKFRSEKNEVRLKIADFGLSQHMDSTGSVASITISNVGTRCWIAPEVLKATKHHSKSSDLFACGLVLCYILSVKKHPFAPTNCANSRMVNVTQTEQNIIENKTEGWDNSLCAESTNIVRKMLEGNESKRPTAAQVSTHPLFWSKDKKIAFLSAVGNQSPEFTCPRDKRENASAVEKDLERKFDTIVKFPKWDDSGYPHMPVIYSEMTKPSGRSSYETSSIIELVRFIRNAYAHVSTLSNPNLLLKDYVFLEYFPNLLIEVYKAVTTNGWDQNREEIISVINRQ